MRFKGCEKAPSFFTGCISVCISSLVSAFNCPIFMFIVIQRERPWLHFKKKSSWGMPVCCACVKMLSIARRLTKATRGNSLFPTKQKSNCAHLNFPILIILCTLVFSAFYIFRWPKRSLGSWCDHLTCLLYLVHVCKYQSRHACMMIIESHFVFLWLTPHKRLVCMLRKERGLDFHGLYLLPPLRVY